MNQTFKNNDKIDEDLYSRQLYVLGRESMIKMQNSDVLIIGLNGTGLEIAKNIVLAGVRSLSIYDTSVVGMNDFSSQFFLSYPEDLGKNKANIIAEKLKDLNKYVSVDVINKFELEMLSSFNCVVATNLDLEQQIKFNEYTHERKIGFINVDVRGLFGQIFIDFGPEFVVLDKNGEEPVSNIISDIDQNGVVSVLHENSHELENGDYVKFSDVKGMSKLNSDKLYQVKVLGPQAFQIDIDKSYGTFEGFGVYTQVRMPTVVNFSSLSEQLTNPDFVVSDSKKFDRPQQLHLGFQALHIFKKDHGGRLPIPYNDNDLIDYLKIVKDLSDKNSNILNDIKLSMDLFKEVFNNTTGDLPPMCAFFGGIVAQEVLKCCSSKFFPIKQWFYFDSLESLPSPETYPRNLETTKPTGSRYDNQIIIFGRDFHNELINKKTFLVGAGAIGCELMKNLSMMGLGSGKDGQVFITDMDFIEHSNLNRQFLFRYDDMKKFKSTVVSQKAQVMNKDFINKIVPFTEKIEVETEKVFNHFFWDKLDFVLNALDNIESRRYVDKCCVFYKKPLIESGTLGTKGNVQVIYPFLTESYSSSYDPPEKTIPLCTLKFFPSKIEHTVAWAKSLFEDFFSVIPQNVNLYLSKQDYITSLKKDQDTLETLENISKYLNNRPYTFDDCIKWARLQFEYKFNHEIHQLLYNLPKDSKTHDGSLFWSGSKRQPNPLCFDINNENHYNFIVSGSNLLAFIYGLKDLNVTFGDYKKVLNKIKIPSFVLKKTDNYSENKINDNENQSLPDSFNNEKYNNLISLLPEPNSLAGYRLNSVIFEKDDNTNHHILFINAASNCRALIYSIKTADKHRTKLFAGKIIPAIATSTSMVSGLVCLEIYKIINKTNDIEKYKNGFFNLALPFIDFSEPIKSKIYKHLNFSFDQIWDTIDLKGDMTLRELLNHFKEEKKLEITMLTYNVSLLYAFFFSKEKIDERLNLRLTELIEKISKKPVLPHMKYLVFEICCSDELGNDVESPNIRLEI